MQKIKKARAFNAAPHPLKHTSNKIIQIETNVKSDAFELEIDSFLFAKAVGNYGDWFTVLNFLMLFFWVLPWLRLKMFFGQGWLNTEGSF
jgi:hypothetical protein